MPRAAYMAPMGWQVLAGLIVKALRSVISFEVCRSNIGLFLPWGLNRRRISPQAQGFPAREP